MRRVLAALAAACALAIAPAAFAQTPPNVIVVGQIAEPQSLDPHAVTAVNDFRILVNVYDGLVRFADGSLEVEPSLAESWEISEDGLTYTFKLREGVTFHDGTPFNAEAVKFNFDRMLDEEHPFHDTGPFPLAFFFSAVEEVTAVDDTTVEFKLNEPFAPFLSNLAYPTGLLVSPAAVEASGKDFGRNPVGTGAYKFEEWQGNQRVVVTRFGQQLARLVGVVGIGLDLFIVGPGEGRRNRARRDLGGSLQHVGDERFLVDRVVRRLSYGLLREGAFLHVEDEEPDVRAGLLMHLEVGRVAELGDRIRRHLDHDVEPA